jgi:hypothetical protein
VLLEGKGLGILVRDFKLVKSNQVDGLISLLKEWTPRPQGAAHCDGKGVFHSEGFFFLCFLLCFWLLQLQVLFLFPLGQQAQS